MLQVPAPATDGSNVPLAGFVIPVPEKDPPGVLGRRLYGAVLTHTVPPGFVNEAFGSGFTVTVIAFDVTVQIPLIAFKE